MFSEKFFSGVVVTSVILVTLGYFIAVDPEDTQVSSPDNVLTLLGVTRQTQPWRIETLDAVALPQATVAYHVKPDGIVLDEPIAVSFRTDSERVSPYKLHPDLHMWEPISGVTRTPDALTFSTSQLGTLVLADVPQVAAPVFSDVYDTLRVQAPRDAVGYEIAVGFSLPDQDVVRLMTAGEQGGCGGTVRVGDGEELSRLERQVVLDIDHEQRPVTIVFVTRWFTSSVRGCTPDEPLTPLSEYDILDKNHL